MIYRYKAKLIRVIDGDTLWVSVDLGFRVYMDMRIRLLGVDTPEIVGKSEKAGVAAKLFVEQELAKCRSSYNDMTVYTQKSDSFDRWLADVHYGINFSLADKLLEAGHAKHWKKKRT